MSPPYDLLGITERMSRFSTAVLKFHKLCHLTSKLITAILPSHNNGPTVHKLIFNYVINLLTCEKNIQILI